MSDNNNNNPPTGGRALPRVTRNASGHSLGGGDQNSSSSGGAGNLMAAGPGMSAPPSTRMQMLAGGPGRGGPQRSHMMRSQSFKRTSSGRAPSTTSSSGASGLPAGSDHSHMSTTGDNAAAAAGITNNSSSSAGLMETRPVISPTSSFNRGTTTRNFVKNFLEEEDDAPAAGTPGGAAAGLNFDAETQRNVHRSLLSPSSPSPGNSPTSPEGRPLVGAGSNSAAYAASPPNGSNLFKGRDDFYNVDQSVNLMDAEAGKYESKNRKQNNNRASMVEIFLKDNPTVTSVSSKLSSSKNKDQKRWWYHPQRQASWERMTTWEKIQDISSRLIIPLICCVIIALVVLMIVIFHWGNGEGDISSENTLAPSETTPAVAPVSSEEMTSEMQSMSKVLQDLKISTGADFQNAKSPTYQALSWVSQDEIALTAVPNDKLRHRGRKLQQEGVHPDTDRLVQRYVLAVLYYTWKPMDSGSDADTASAAAMSSMTLEPPSNGGAAGAATAGDNELWLSAVSECHWMGIDCRNEAQELATMGVLGGSHSGATQIRALNLTAHKLKGTIPKELHALTTLVELDLRNNSLSGNLDGVNFANWKQLEYLLLGGNSLTGRIPEGLSELERIIDIDLSTNKLSGPLPSLTGGQLKLEDLENLFLNGNMLTGSIPDSMLKDVPNLEYLDVGDNKLNGPLPDAIANLPRLRYLHANNNSFTGTLPQSIASMSHLETLYVEFNNFEGNIPDLSNMERLANLHLNHNRFAGKFPEGLSSLKRVKLIKIGGNQLTGTLPSELFDASKPLVYLDLGRNKMKGPLPASLGTVGSTLFDLRISENGFSGTLPPELGQLSQLRTCFLFQNSFTGTVPASWSGMAMLENLRLQDNNLSGSMPQEICDFEKEFESDKDAQLLILADCKTGSIKCDCCHHCY